MDFHSLEIVWKSKHLINSEQGSMQDLTMFCKQTIATNFYNLFKRIDKVKNFNTKPTLANPVALW